MDRSFVYNRLLGGVAAVGTVLLIGWASPTLNPAASGSPRGRGKTWPNSWRRLETVEEELQRAAAGAATMTFLLNDPHGRLYLAVVFVSAAWCTVFLSLRCTPCAH